MSWKSFWVIAGSEICYNRLDCFSEAAPWGGTMIRPLKMLPWTPSIVSIHFILYTNENPSKYQIRTLTHFQGLVLFEINKDNEGTSLLHFLLL